MSRTSYRNEAPGIGVGGHVLPGLGSPETTGLQTQDRESATGKTDRGGARAVPHSTVTSMAGGHLSTIRRHRSS